MYRPTDEPASVAPASPAPQGDTGSRKPTKGQPSAKDVGAKGPPTATVKVRETAKCVKVVTRKGSNTNVSVQCTGPEDVNDAPYYGERYGERGCAADDRACAADRDFPSADEMEARIKSRMRPLPRN